MKWELENMENQQKWMCTTGDEAYMLGGGIYATAAEIEAVEILYKDDPDLKMIMENIAARNGFKLKWIE